MVGNHANGEASRHQLVNVLEAYQTVLKEAQLPDPILQGRRNDILNQTSAINSRAKAVEKMGSQLESNLEEMFKKCVQELRDIIQQKLTVLLGDELELKRQKHEIDRLDEFLKYQEMGDPTNFLFNWSRHQNVRATLHDFRFFRNGIDVNLNAKITGSVAVIVDEDQVVNRTEAQTRIKSPISKLGNSMQQMGFGLPKGVESRVQRRTSV
jgi:hypothetical protein